MKSLMGILLLATSLCARGQTNTSPEALEAHRAAAYERGRERSEYLDARTNESQEVARSNRLSQPQRSGPRMVNAPANNPVADMAELLARRGVTTESNKVVITERGEGHVMPKIITDRLAKQWVALGMGWRLTNYNSNEIITITKEKDAELRLLRRPSGMSPEEYEKWKRENVPHWYNPHADNTPRSNTNDPAP